MSEITQAQYNTAKQSQRNISIRINLLNFSKQIIDSIEGQVIGGSITSDANSNMRNTCDIQMVVTDSSFNVEAEGKIWMDRYIQIYIGVEDLKTHQTIWTNKGIYLLNQPTYGYSAESKVLSFQGVDMMALLTDMRGGMLSEAYLIPAGSNVRDVIITILGVNGINEYVVDDCKNSDGSIQPVPYDMTFDIGSTWWDVLESLQSILPNYQMYFDVDGVFHYEPTPYKPNEVVRMDDDIWRQNVISENVSYDFESVKNSVKVLGRTHPVNYFATNVTVNEATINLTIPNLTELTDGALIGFTLTKSVYGNIMLNVNNLGAVKLSKLDGSYVTSLAKGEYWTASYDADNQSWKFLGHVQAVGEWMDDNPNSPFFVGNPAGAIKIVLYGGEYDNIMSDELATQRAEWEIYQRCRMNDSITLTSVPIYWSEVNWMVAYTPLGQDVVNHYLIRSITTDLTYDGTQTYNMIRWYPYYIQYVPATGAVEVYINTSGEPDTVPTSAANGDFAESFRIVANCYSKAARFPEVKYYVVSNDTTPTSRESSAAKSRLSLIDTNSEATLSPSSAANKYYAIIDIISEATSSPSSLVNADYAIIDIISEATSSPSSLVNADYAIIDIISEAKSSPSSLVNAHHLMHIMCPATAVSAEATRATIGYEVKITTGAIAAYDSVSPAFGAGTISQSAQVSPILADGSAVIGKYPMLSAAANPISIPSWEYPVQKDNTLRITRVYSATQNGNTLILT